MKRVDVLLLGFLGTGLSLYLASSANQLFLSEEGGVLGSRLVKHFKSETSDKLERLSNHQVIRKPGNYKSVLC